MVGATDTKKGGGGQENGAQIVVELLSKEGITEEEYAIAMEDGVSQRLASLMIAALNSEEVSSAEAMEGLEVAEILEGFGGSSEDSIEELETQIELLNSLSVELNDRFTVKVQQKERMSILETNASKELDSVETFAQSIDRDIEQLKGEMSVLLQDYVSAIAVLEQSFTDLASSLRDAGSETFLPKLLGAFWKQTDDFVDAVQQFISRSCNSLEIQDVNQSLLWQKRLATMKEVSRLQEVFVLSEMERIDATVALEELRAAHETAKRQLSHLKNRELPPLEGSRFEGQVVVKQKQITELQLQACTLKENHLGAILGALKLYESLPIVESQLNLTCAANSKVLGHHVLASSLLENLRLSVDVVQVLLEEQLQQYEEISEHCAQAAAQLYQTSKEVGPFLTETAQICAPCSETRADAPAEGKGEDREAMMALYVAMGGREDDLAAGWLSEQDVREQAAKLGRSLAQSTRAEQDLRRQMWADSRHLAGHCVEMERNLRTRVGVEEERMAATPEELKTAMAELEEVKSVLDERLQEIQRRRQEPRHALPSFFVDFFLRPDILVPSRK